MIQLQTTPRVFLPVDLEPHISITAEYAIGDILGGYSEHVATILFDSQWIISHMLTDDTDGYPMLIRYL